MTTLNEEMNIIIDRALLEEFNKKEKRTYLGASILGYECKRKIYYTYHHTVPDKPISGRIVRLFEEGHRQEEVSANNLRLSGFDINTLTPQNEQYGFEDADGQIQGHVDAILLAGPLDIPYPSLWEHKTMNEKYYKSYEKLGLKKSHPDYYGQIQTNMAYLGIDSTLVHTLNKNNSDYSFELIYIDYDTAQKCSDKGYQVLTAESDDDLTRISGDANDYRCKRLCSYYKTCWRKTGDVYLEEEQDIPDI